MRPKVTCSHELAIRLGAQPAEFKAKDGHFPHFFIPPGYIGVYCGGFHMPMIWKLRTDLTQEKTD